MKEIQEHSETLKAQISKHAASYPVDAQSRDELVRWRHGFDELRGDLDRLEFAQKNPASSSSRSPLSI